MPGRRAVVLPSPLLGSGVYAEFAGALAQQSGIGGVTVAEAHLDGAQGPLDLVARWAVASRGADVLVAHSNAGHVAPSVSSAAGGRRIPVVFLDAALPAAAGRSKMAPAELLDGLRHLADEAGRLPPWPRWWSAEQLTGVIPGPLVERLDRACPRVALSYLDSEIRVPEGWTDGRHAYIAFGDTYADERRRAAEHGWSTRTLDGGHLHFLHDPVAVAAALAEILNDPCPTGTHAT